MKTLPFKCPTCGHSVLEEIQVGVTVTSEVKDVTDDGEIHYTDVANEGGEVARYQCNQCGYTITDETGGEVVNQDDLVIWLQKHS